LIRIVCSLHTLLPTCPPTHLPPFLQDGQEHTLLSTCQWATTYVAVILGMGKNVMHLWLSSHWIYCMICNNKQIHFNMYLFLLIYLIIIKLFDCTQQYVNKIYANSNPITNITETKNSIWLMHKDEEWYHCLIIFLVKYKCDAPWDVWPGSFDVVF
jgi:hypothetical protein